MNSRENDQSLVALGLLISTISIEDQHAVVAVLLEAQEAIGKNGFTPEADSIATQDVVNVDAVSTDSCREIFEFQGVTKVQSRAWGFK